MRFVVAIGAVSLALAGDALACSCIPVNLARDLPRADGAFVGTLLSRQERGNQAVFRFRVEQVYKGDIENRVEVVSARGGAACGLELPVGARTGLLLQRSGATWTSSLCSQVEPAAFLKLTDVADNTLPLINWGGYVVGLLVLGAGTFFLVRRLRHYRSLR